MLFSIWPTLLLIAPLFLPTHQKRTPGRTARAQPTPPPPTMSTAAPVEPNVLQITRRNFNSTLHAYEVVFINFYADWCHFSTRLMPIFEDAAVRLAEKLPPSAGVRLARVDCMLEVELSNMCDISKFPTLRLYYRGHPLRQEYRGQRSVEALVAYVKKQFESSIKTIINIQELDEIDVTRRSVIGFFESRKELSAALFVLLAERYKNDCDFYIRIGAKLDNVAFTEKMPTIVYRPDVARTHAADEIYYGDAKSQIEMEEWLFKKCVPLVREVDFGNVEEIIEQRLPLLVLFHMPDDVGSVKDFKSIVEMQLAGCVDCGQFNFVTVNGLKFQHSVLHMGKTQRDLPLIAIDSLKFMYPYPKFKDMYIPGHLKMFISDFSSQHLKHKLKMRHAIEHETNPPPLSTFKDLGPSKHRYSLVGHDEL
nr:endoplasmic reticulum resident protein 44 [Drosophila virilis]